MGKANKRKFQDTRNQRQEITTIDSLNLKKFNYLNIFDSYKVLEFHNQVNKEMFFIIIMNCSVNYDLFYIDLFHP